jgi:hypothetical protein
VTRRSGINGAASAEASGTSGRCKRTHEALRRTPAAALSSPAAICSSPGAGAASIHLSVRSHAAASSVASATAAAGLRGLLALSAVVTCEARLTSSSQCWLAPAAQWRLSGVFGAAGIWSNLPFAWALNPLRVREAFTFRSLLAYRTVTRLCEHDRSSKEPSEVA